MVATGAVRFGTFRLASGATSDHYIDVKRLLLDPIGLNLVADRVGVILREMYPRVTRVGGPELGVVPLVGAVVTGMRWRARAVAAFHPGAVVADTPLGFVVRHTPKSHGTGRRIEGPMIDDTPPGHPDYPMQTFVRSGGVVPEAAVLEDVVTTGESLWKAVMATLGAGAEVRVAVAVVDRRADVDPPPFSILPAPEYIALYRASEVLQYAREYPA